jgi:hypothetical protein
VSYNNGAADPEIKRKTINSTSGRAVAPIPLAGLQAREESGRRRIPPWTPWVQPFGGCYPSFFFRISRGVSLDSADVRDRAYEGLEP